ncbi:ATP-dependent RNA helicase, DEAD box family protein [Anopheles sinensis]|uniref:ATP-dependent RNA helicase, DEAD box family protein n=1 Tax=Anopheles sinensis TaxID=74873 RepID=A0A084W1G5_ANOSI|nr:ATP-dependent RNA helicase, DEAD box family protein [Anopheles sinensis]
MVFYQQRIESSGNTGNRWTPLKFKSLTHHKQFRRPGWISFSPPKLAFPGFIIGNRSAAREAIEKQTKHTRVLPGRRRTHTKPTRYSNLYRQSRRRGRLVLSRKGKNDGNHAHYIAFVISSRFRDVDDDDDASD